MLIQIRDQRLVKYIILLIFGGLLLMLVMLKIIEIRKKMDIMGEKSKNHLKNLIKRYQIYLSHIKRILKLYIPVEHLHLAIYQNPSIRLLLLHILKVLY